MLEKGGNRKHNNIVDRVLLVGLLATTFMLPTMFGSISIILALLLALIGGLYGLTRLKGVGNFVWQPTLTMLLLSFVLLAVVSAISANKIADLSFLVSFLGLVLPILLYQFLRLLPSPLTFSQIAKFCLIGCSLGLIFAFAQRFELGIGRTVAIAAGSNAVARVAVLLGLLALTGLALEGRAVKKVYLLAPIFAVGIVMLTGSRGALISLPALFLIVFLFAAPLMWARAKKLLGALVIAAVAGAVILYTLNPFGFISRSINTVSVLLSGNVPGSSSELRYEMLVGAWEAFHNSPITGYGWFGLWDALIANHSKPEMFASVKQYFSYHNDLADFAVAGGLVGVCIYILLIGAPVLNLMLDKELRTNRTAAYALIIIPASYLLFGLTDFTFGFDLLTTLYGFSLAFVLAVAKSPTVQLRVS